MSAAPRRTLRGNFVPISIEEYIPLHMKSNPAEPRAALEAALRESLEAAEHGECFDCGEPIWVLGSAIVGRACFTCVTGQSNPTDDFEIVAVRWHANSTL
jgi:hypothetical protein